MPTRIPTQLTDSQLTDAVARCARGERDATVLLVAHWAEMDTRRLRPAANERSTAVGSRHVPAQVRRAVWTRDRGRCAFVSSSGRRCGECGRLELHHVEPYAMGGASTVANIELRCRAHNTHEAVLFYGSNKPHEDHGLSQRHSTGRPADKNAEAAVATGLTIVPPA